VKIFFTGYHRVFESAVQEPKYVSVLYLNPNYSGYLLIPVVALLCIEMIKKILKFQKREIRLCNNYPFYREHCTIHRRAQCQLVRPRCGFRRINGDF